MSTAAWEFPDGGVGMQLTAARDDTRLRRGSFRTAAREFTDCGVGFPEGGVGVILYGFWFLSMIIVGIPHNGYNIDAKTNSKFICSKLIYLDIVYYY